MDNFISIGKLSEIVGVSIRTIRYYEEVGILKPAGITDSNYRVYGNEEIVKLKLILLLKKIGFSLHEIKSLITNGDNTQFLEHVRNRQAQIITEMSKLVCIKDFLDDFISNFESKELPHKDAIQMLVDLNSSKVEGINMNDYEIMPIKVIGIGNGGINFTNKMVEDTMKMDYICIDTDKQTLAKSKAYGKIQIGENYTKGFGTGGDCSVGKRSADESIDLVKECLKGCDLLFITTCMGGGTGSAAASVIASAAREMGILTAALVTSPSILENEIVKKNAEDGIESLRGSVDFLLVIPVDMVHKTLNVKSVEDIHDEISALIMHSIQGISELITSSIIGLNFEDVKFLMREKGMAYIGVGNAVGENRAELAAKQAISSPMLEKNIGTASGIILNITGNNTLSLLEVNLITELILKSANPNVNMIYGAVINEKVKDEIAITVVVTGCN